MREQELQRLQADLQVKEDEIKKVKEPLTYKEEELLRREEDLMYREKVLQAEHRKMEEAKAQGGSVEELDLKSRLEELKSTITAKEEEVRTKERYLQQKMEELRLREQGLISEDIEARDKDLQVEVKQQKVKMGIPRLDDLLFGGIPFGTNASVYGPAYVGKEVLVSLFMAEGLKKGVPVLWILTDKGRPKSGRRWPSPFPDTRSTRSSGWSNTLTRIRSRWVRRHRIRTRRTSTSRRTISQS